MIIIISKARRSSSRFGVEGAPSTHCPGSAIRNVKTRSSDTNMISSRPPTPRPYGCAGCCPGYPGGVGSCPG